MSIESDAILPRAAKFVAMRAYLDELRAVLGRLDCDVIGQVVEALLDAYGSACKIFILGNGGSAATASHFACDLGKGVSGLPGRRFKALALTDNVPLLTAWANDTTYEGVFAEQLDNLVQARDVVVAISGSGNSPNVLRAMELARERGATTIGFTGFKGGLLKDLCDICVVVPSDKMDHIEDTHHALQHLICRSLRDLLAEYSADDLQSRSRVNGEVVGV